MNNKTPTKTTSKSTVPKPKPKTTTSAQETPSSDKKPLASKTPVKKTTVPAAIIANSNKLDKPKPSVTKAPVKPLSTGIKPESIHDENPPLVVNPKFFE